MRKDLFISLEKEIYSGNVLDIGLSNYGVVYNIYKHYNKSYSIDYFEGEEGESFIEKGVYDNCILFFALKELLLKKHRKNLFKDINLYLKEGATIYIWDIDKGYKNIFDGNIKIAMPDNTIKNIRVRDYNIFKDISFQETLKMVKEYFNIIEEKSSDGIYFIKARKEGIVKDENTTDGS